MACNRYAVPSRVAPPPNIGTTSRKRPLPAAFFLSGISVRRGFARSGARETSARRRRHGRAVRELGTGRAAKRRGGARGHLARAPRYRFALTRSVRTGRRCRLRPGARRDVSGRSSARATTAEARRGDLDRPSAGAAESQAATRALVPRSSRSDGMCGARQRAGRDREPTASRRPSSRGPTDRVLLALMNRGALRASFRTGRHRQAPPMRGPGVPPLQRRGVARRRIRHLQTEAR